MTWCPTPTKARYPRKPAPVLLDLFQRAEGDRAVRCLPLPLRLVAREEQGEAEREIQGEVASERAGQMTVEFHRHGDWAWAMGKVPIAAGTEKGTVVATVPPGLRPSALTLLLSPVTRVLTGPRQVWDGERGRWVTVVTETRYNVHPDGRLTIEGPFDQGAFEAVVDVCWPLEDS